MTASTIRMTLGRLLTGGAAATPVVLVQHIGFDGADAVGLAPLLAGVGRDLGLRLVADEVHGELVLVADGFAERVSPSVMAAFLSDRPMVRVDRRLLADPAAAREHLARTLVPHLVARQSVQLRAGAGHTASSGCDSGFDSTLQADRLEDAELDPDRSELLSRLRRGLVDPSQPPLLAGYGPGAAMAIDFAVGVARIDGAADHRLRVSRQVPYLGQGVQPGPDARERELDLVTWDIAMAAGSFRLLRAPANWWRTELIAPTLLSVSRYTVQPQHLELARALAAEPLTPAQLCRLCRVSLVELRSFLQACLMLGLAQWVDSSTAN